MQVQEQEQRWYGSTRAVPVRTHAQVQKQVQVEIQKQAQLQVQEETLNLHLQSTHKGRHTWRYKVCRYKCTCKARARAGTGASTVRRLSLWKMGWLPSPSHFSRVAGSEKGTLLSFSPWAGTQSAASRTAAQHMWCKTLLSRQKPSALRMLRGLLLGGTIACASPPGPP